ncbi:MAG TPA: SPFH domain-containing protein, partial [Arenimonas sp.]|uniref:SPFH domain-containing protein n=1 Tax=Arenimonas sp. TaxID=1872635 RepID=UPI002C393F43
NGGNKGLQEQVLLAGRYFLNPRFATVEVVDMFTVPIAHVGVVIAYIGREGSDVTGEGFKHANLVSRGEKGVCIDPLDPGKYPINPNTHKVVNVPTANVVLNWATGKTEAHRLDANLSTITVRSGDGFKFNMDVSQIIHIPRNDAPKVIARFGDMSALVTQVLEPTIGNYFRNAAQGSDIIDFLKNRSTRQNEAREAISAALREYNVGAVDTLIGDIVPPDELMRTLTDRKIAEQERVTYETQRQAQSVRQELQQATALADTQARVVDAERKVTIAGFEASASVKFAEGSAKSKTINAEADANVLRTVGEAEGAKIKAVGGAEAEVIRLKVASMEAGNFAVVQVAEALAKGGIKIVPDIVAGGGADGSGGGLVNVLLGNMLHQDYAGRQAAKLKSGEKPE